MKFISAIIASCLFSGVAVGQDMDALSRVQIDAATRASLKPQWMTMNLGGFIQTGWQYSNGGGLPSENGFFVQSGRLELTGDITDESMSYQVAGEWSDSTGSFDLIDANLTLRMFDFANVRVGRFVSDFYQGFVDNPTHLTTKNYSVSALTFGQGRGDGIELFRSFGEFEVSGFYNNGFDNLGGVGSNNYALGISGRYDLGDDLTFSGGFARNSVGSQQVNNITAGASYVNGPWDASADFILNNEGDNFDNWSVVSTLGYQCTEYFQGFAQWEIGKYDGDLNLLTVGGNYDLGHNLVWTNTLGLSMQSLGSQFVTDNTGWRSSSDRGQWVARSVITFSF
tara:strand:+ start:59 stop:1075 length:1017 start_codon:yes stop_codon:yes gene_type:complete